MILRRRESDTARSRREEQEHLEENIASELRGVSRETRETVLDYLNRADRDYGGRVAEKSGA